MRTETKKELLRRLFSGIETPDSSLVRDILRIKDYDLEDSAKLDEIIKRTEENNPRLSLFSEFLGCNVLDQTINTKVFPKYKKGIISVAADKIIKEKFDIVQKMWFGYYDNLQPVQVEEIQIDLDKTSGALIKGYYFLTNKETKKNCIFGVDFVSDMFTGYLAIYSNEEELSSVSGVMNEIVSWAKNNNFLKGKKIDSSGKFLKIDNITMDDVILKDEVKRRIISGTIDMIKNMDTYRKNNLPIKRGILMEGEPGTGKTLVAKALCNQMDCTFIWVTPDDIRYPEDIAYVYQMAREVAPTIVLFEDIDYIGKSREMYRDSRFDKITGELLNQMDGLESNEGIITLASSNYPEFLDKALRNRPGRFDMRIKFDLPDEDLREKMLTKFFGNVNIDDVDIKDMIKMTENYTGAYIKELIVATVMLAVSQKSVDANDNAIITKKHLMEAFSELEKSREADDMVGG